MFSSMDKDICFSDLFTEDQVTCICESLYQTKDGKRLISFFSSDSQLWQRYVTNSSVTIAYLYALFSFGKYQEVCEYIGNGKFNSRYFGELKNLWYEAKYAEDQRKKKKPLGPVEKYRLRKKHPPPSTIWDGHEVIYSFRDCDRQVLKQYYHQNKYPNPTEKKKIAEITGLDVTQISNWFKNRRQRDKPGSDSSLSPRPFALNYI
uniref:Homeobox domain-containing protein n=1 Tax=Panagrolaimus sp. ES5 TaxID=591445 RepID=A0AC34FDZ9_9BILA